MFQNTVIVARPPGQRRRPRRSFPEVGAGLLLLSAIFRWLSHVCGTLGQRSIGEPGALLLARAVRTFQSGRDRSFSTIALSVLGTLFLFWALLFLGGGVWWLVTHGMAFVLLPVAVIIGVAVGLTIAKTSRAPGHDRSN